MYKFTRSCKLLSKVIVMAQRATNVGELRYHVSIWHRLRLDGSPTRLCTSLAEDKNLRCSDKALANTKEEQLCYGSKTVYKFLHSDSSTDNSDSDCDFEAEMAEFKAMAMMEEEARIQKEILANYKEGELYRYNPNIKYEPLKRYDVPRFVFSDDSSSDLSDLESDAHNETVAEAAQTQKDKILAGTKDEPLSHYDLAKSLMSTDLQSVAENLAATPSTDLQSTVAVPSLSVLSAQDKLGAKGPAGGGIKYSKLAKETDFVLG